MERRKLLLGSGVALATALAGCTGSGGNGDDEEPDDGKNDDGKNDGTDGTDDVPGLDLDGVDLEEHGVTIETVDKDGKEVSVEIRAKTTDHERLHETVVKLGKILEDAIDDPEAFVAAIDRINVTLLDDEKNPVLSFFVDVEWAIDFIENELTDEEFVEKVTETTA